MIRDEDFLRIMHKTLDDLAENYRLAFDNRGRIKTDRACYDFIDDTVEKEAYRIGFREYYERRKRKENNKKSL